VIAFDLSFAYSISESLARLLYFLASPDSLRRVPCDAPSSPFQVLCALPTISRLTCLHVPLLPGGTHDRPEIHRAVGPHGMANGVELPFHGGGCTFGDAEKEDMDGGDTCTLQWQERLTKLESVDRSCIT
jgi:hypothetical protein